MQELAKSHADLPSVAELTLTLRELVPQVRRFGNFNFLLSNGEALWAHCSTHLHWLVRQHPFTQATLKDQDWTVDFAQLAQPGDRAAVIVTQPLTDNEAWTAFAPKRAQGVCGRAAGGRVGGRAVNAWLTLGIAIVAEVIGTSALKASEGFTRWLPSLVVVLGYAVAFYCLSLVLRHIPVGVAYAVWSGLGIVLITLVAFVLYGQKIDTAGLIGMGLIVAGVLVLNLVFQDLRALNAGARLSGASPAAGAALFAQHEEVEPFHFLARPWRLAQEFQAGAHARVHVETADGDAVPEFVPAVVVGQRGDNGFERQTVQRVAWLLGGRLGRLACWRVGGLIAHAGALSVFSSASTNIAGTSNPVWSWISWKQVGLVTLISVTRLPIMSSPTSSRPRCGQHGRDGFGHGTVLVTQRLRHPFAAGRQVATHLATPAECAPARRERPSRQSAAGACHRPRSRAGSAAPLRWVAPPWFRVSMMEPRFIAGRRQRGRCPCRPCRPAA